MNAGILQEGEEKMIAQYLDEQSQEKKSCERQQENNGCI